MNDTSARLRLPYLSYLFLGLVSVWLIGFHRSSARSEEDRWLVSAMTLLGLYIGFWVERTIHGILPALIVALLFVFSVTADSFLSEPSLLIRQLTQMMLVAVVGLLWAIWSQLDRVAERPTYWGMIWLAVWMLSSLLWIEAFNMQSMAALFSKSENSEFQRIGQATMGFLMVGGLIGVGLSAYMRKKRHGCRLVSKSMILAVAVLVCAPLVGFALVRLWVPVRLESLMDGSCWADYGNSLHKLVSAYSLPYDVDSKWKAPWLVVPLIVVAFWRTIGRGHREWKRDRMPMAWLFSLWVSLWLLLGFPIALKGDGIIFVGLLGVLLPVFAVADLIVLFYEQLALPVPPEGPADIPHVPHP